MKILNGAELAGYLKEKQAQQVRSLRARGVRPKLVIIRDSANPVIEKYVKLKCVYGEDIGMEVEDWRREDLETAVREANANENMHGIIIQMPLKNMEKADEILQKIAPEKDVDGLGKSVAGRFDSATATAIHWLLTGFGVELANKKIAIVGRGRLVGGPLEMIWQKSGYDVTIFEIGSDLRELRNFDIVVSATGAPRIITSEMLRSGAVVVDAGTASEDGILVGDVDESVRERNDLAAITPKVGGVGPMTVAVLFEHVIEAGERVSTAHQNVTPFGI